MTLYETIAATIAALDDAGPAALNCLAMKCAENAEDMRLNTHKRRIWRMFAALARRLEKS